jgi:hypothetical protein
VEKCALSIHRHSKLWRLCCGFGVLLTLLACRTTPINIAPVNCYFEISQSQVPERIRRAFEREIPDAKVLSTKLFIAGDRLIFYVFRFEKDGRLQQAQVSQGEELGAVYDVSEEE